MKRLFGGGPQAEAEHFPVEHSDEEWRQKLSPAQFQAAAAKGRMAPGEIGYAFGKMSLAAFIDGCSGRDFEQSLVLARLA